MYDKKFLKTERGYLPLILIGASNCTMFVGGREVLEREWACWNDKLIFCSKEKLEEFAESCSHIQYEYFKEGSRWICGKDIKKWFANAIKKASRLEDLLKVNPCRCLRCYVWLSNKETYEHKTLFLSYIRTEKDLFEWYDKYKDYKEDDWNTYLHIGFDGHEKLSSIGATDGRVIASFGRGKYLERFDNYSYTITYNKAEAMIFESIADFEERVKNCSISRYQHKFLKA